MTGEVPADDEDRAPHARLVSRDGVAVEIETSSGHTIRFDEPEDRGGTDTGPSPTSALAASLAACTVITLELYAGRKGWDIDGIEASVETTFEGYRASAFEVKLEFPDHLDDDQVDRLRTIAGKCPVHRALAETTAVEIV